MITDDDVMRLFEEADPARVHAEIPRVDATGYLDALRLRTTDMTLTEISSPLTPSRERHRLITLAAVILVAVLIAGGAIALVARSSTRDSVTNPPLRPPAVQVASNFLAAYAAYDADRVASLLGGRRRRLSNVERTRLAPRAPLHESHRPESRRQLLRRSRLLTLADPGALPLRVQRTPFGRDGSGSHTTPRGSVSRFATERSSTPR